MRLISCHIENFGRLQDFDYVFSDGVNIICRDNGWGKSTFAAFLLAMFYGLPSKGKKRRAVSGGNRLSVQDARDACRPWQGGTFGGRLIFEAGGGAYEMTRVFGDRESEDQFDLRDLETNLPCFDYTKNIGKEMFALDRESFLRTVFTSQQDCLTRPTDDVNALVADLAEYAGDLESYEAAQKHLRDAANRLTPKRSTGRLHRMQEQISRLERETASGRDLEERISLCGQEGEEVQGRIKALEQERALLEKEITSAEQEERAAAEAGQAEQSLLAKRQIREQLSAAKERRRKALESAAAFFPGRVPTRAEADSLLKNCRDMERLEERMQAGMLTAEEQERLTRFEEGFGGREPLGRAAGPGREKSFRQRAAVPAVGALLILIAVLCAVMAFRTGSLQSGLALPAVAASIILAAAGAGILAAAAKRAELPAGSDAYAEYLRLEKKEQKLEETHADWAEARKPILLFLKELGFSPSKDLHSQLTAIRDAADECEDAGALLRESSEELRLFEEEMMRGARDTRIRTGGQSGRTAAELRKRREQAHEELLRCRSLAAETERRMEELSLERDEQEIMLEELKELREQQKADMDKYRRVMAASLLLQKAKESLTSRYADPIRTAFCKYWELISGKSAAGIYLDANSNVTFEEEGRQREAVNLSTGWRDLAGICLRTALADAMYPPERGERPPLFLDDPFSNLDDTKMEGAMRFLGEIGRNYQVLYFTCSSSRC